MTIEQLQYFYAINVYKTFSNAANNIHISQSSLSKQIASLEKELNITLFDRRYRQAKLTQEGQQLLKYVQKILNDYDEMMDFITTINHNHQNTLHIAILPILFQYDFSSHIKMLQQKYPDIQILIDEIEERDLDSIIDKHKYDIYILRGQYDNLKDYHSLCLYKDELVALVSKNHHLSKKSKLDIYDLKNHNLLLPPKYTMISKIAYHTCLQYNFEPIILRHGRMETILSGAKDNQGIAIMMKKALHIFHLQNVKAIPFNPSIEADIYAYYKNKSKAIDHFIDFFTTRLK